MWNTKIYYLKEAGWSTGLYFGYIFLASKDFMLYLEITQDSM